MSVEQLILSVRKEPSIWNIYSPDFLHKYLRVEAWNRVGIKLTPDWDKQSPASRQKIIRLLKDKWRHIRGYYIRDKREQANSASKNVKRKGYAHSNILTFLDPVLGHRRAVQRERVSINFTDALSNDAAQDEEEVAKSSEESQDLNHTSIACEPDVPNNLTAQPMVQWNEMPTESPQDRSQYSHTQRHAAPAEHMMQQTIPSFLGVNPNVAFLISCSQEMDEMTAIQRIDFKSGVIKLIKSIKYSNDNVNR